MRLFDGTLLEGELTTTTLPYKHQTEALERFRDRAYGALFLEQGLGKSKIAIDIAVAKFLTGEITGVLVISPKSLIDNWALIEIPKHCTSVGYMVQPWRQKPMVFAKGEELSWFVANVDAVIRENWAAAFRLFYKAHPKFMLVIDESTTVKTPNVQRTQRMMQVADYAKARFILSGAPITNSPLDIWAQAEIMQPGIWGSNFFMFKQRYAVTEKVTMYVPGGRERTFTKISGYQKLDELTEKIKTFAVIAKKADCLDLPPKIYRQVPVEFTTEQAKHYNNLKNLALTQIDDQRITAVNAVSLINSLLQICAGQLKLPDETYSYLETNRVELLTDILDESPEKGLIWCSFIGAADAIEKALGARVMRIRAETPPEDRQSTLDEYERAEGTPALLLNQASMGKGLTILEGRNMVYYSQRFSVEQRVQSEDRPHRIGQTKSILISELYTPGTVEEKVINVLRTNRALANRIITDRTTLREFIA